MKNGYEKTLDLIILAKDKKIEELDLSLFNLKKVPNEIGELTHLTSLDLSCNRLQELPREIGKLTNLIELNLCQNCIKDLPKEIGVLTNLTSIDISFNQLTNLPEEFFNLKNLEFLRLSANKIKIFPKKIVEFKNLKTLRISVNQLAEFPEEIIQLENLEVLHLTYNNITHIHHEINRLNNLKVIKLDGNPLKIPPIEIGIRGIEAIRNYFESIKEEKTSRLYEAKLLIVGEGGVGKTCLMKKLINTELDINKEEITTEGIDIKKWLVETDKIKNLRINFWDFGGQEIYHATHQFFLTKRSLYLFVWEARKDDNLLSFDYWLNVIKLLSNQSPIIVVLNKIDERIRMIDEQSIKNKFGNIVSFCKVSAANGIGIKELAEIIKSEIIKIEHIGDTLPNVWLDVRENLEKLNKNFIGYSEYIKICNHFDLDEKKACFLSQYFHDLGVFLHFHDNDILRNIIFLKPEWATKAVYKIVDTKEVQKNYGKFNYNELKEIWNNYPEDKYTYLLELMKRFELCFQIPNSQNYIVPELLRSNKPEFDWETRNSLRFEYSYEFMPAGIITRFIVRNHDLIKDDIYWKNGLVLTWENTEALIISEPLDRKIKIWINGKEKKGLLAIIKREIDYIHQTLNKPDVKEMLPCICSECKNSENPYFHNYQDLTKAISKGKKEIECKNSFEAVSIESIFGGIKGIEPPTIGITHKNLHVQGDIIINAGISKEVLNELIRSVMKFSAEEKRELKNQYVSVENADTKEEKVSKMKNLKLFIIDAGVSIANSISASTLFEILKRFL
jgi:small GTP-binding protein